MKLLPKQLANAEVATQRKELIDQGVQLASKVDVLRETLVKEEGNLQRFRTEITASVQQEIDMHLHKKYSLEKEINGLEAKRTFLLVPLDAEWKEVYKEKDLINGLKQGLLGREQLLSESNQKVINLQKEVAIEKNRAEDLNHRASQRLTAADETLAEANAWSTKIRKEAQDKLSSADLREKAVSLQEQDILVREQEVEKVWQRVQDKEKDLAIREVQLKDRYETWERSIKRLKK